MTPPTRVDTASESEGIGQAERTVLARAVEFFADVAVLEPTFRLADFQQQALEASRRILALRRGVLVADGVGLGKTFVALALIEEELRRAGHVVVSAPATLRRHWQLPLLRLARKYGSSSGGLCRDTARSALGTGHIHWVSHTRLSRGWSPTELRVPQSLTVVDEAHGFRNPATRRYRALAAGCASGRVVLLTATPVCNSLSDLYFLLRLFASDSAFADVGVMDLAGLFTADRPDAVRVRAVLAEVMVRRTRAALRESAGGLRLPGGGGFPRLRPPELIRYEADDAHRDILRSLEQLRFPPFRPGTYGAAGRSGQAAELLRCMLLKRLESSDAAARASVTRLERFLRTYVESLSGGRLLTARDFRSLAPAAGAGEQLILGELVLDALPRPIDRRRLHRDCVGEITLLRQMEEALAGRTDRKLAALCSLVEGKRGVIVFTEFQETADLIWRALLQRGGRIGRVDGSGAWLGAQRASRATVIARFAPNANGSRCPHPRERVDILVATDLLSEGLNLQDAHAVVSYDLPWNPTRLMQRVGRIDRLGSPHQSISSFVFMPGEHLEELLGLVRRIRGKLQTIEASVGAETWPIDPPAWVPDACAIEALRDGRSVVADDPLPAEQPSSPGLFAFAGVVGGAASRSDIDGSAAIRTTAVSGVEWPAGVLLLGLLGDVQAACFYDPGTGALAPIRAEDVRALLHHGSECSASHPPAFSQVASALAAANVAFDAAPAPTGVVTRVAGILLRAVAADSRICSLERAEALLKRVRRGVPIGTDLQLRALLRSPPPDTDGLMTAIDRALSGIVAPAAPGQFRPLFALEVRSGRPANTVSGGVVSG